MKLPTSWLAEYLELPEVEHLASQLSLKAFEVSSLECHDPGLRGPVLAGLIVAVEPHPNADRLQIARVTVDPEQAPLAVVCGAPNIAPGQIVPVALPGARVRGGELQIRRSRIREVESDGMLCSAQELGLEDSSDGIYVLPADLPVASDLVEYLRLNPELVLDIEPRSNRGDALSIQGIAREAAAALHKPMLIDRMAQHPHRLGAGQLDTIPVRVDAPEACQRIGFARITGLRIEPSPRWMAKRLELAGISSINNVVDVTNYVMLELGQPLHAYDARMLSGDMVVRWAQDGEKLATLDGGLSHLTPENLLITTADGSEPVSLAGVMGGAASGVREDTTEILLEAACFLPQAVRRSSRLSGIASESSRRFERGTDIGLPEMALYRALELLGGELAGLGWAGSVGTAPHNPAPLELCMSHYRELIGTDLSPQQARELLESLGFGVELSSGDALSVRVPGWRRHDVTRPVDLIEEIARLDGLQKIPSQAPPGHASHLDDGEELRQLLRHRLWGWGYDECVLSSLVAAEPDSGVTPVCMKNPLTRESAQLRTSMLPGLLAFVQRKHRRQADLVRVFEIGRVYNAVEGAAQETDMLAIAITNRRPQRAWNGYQHGSQDFFELKGVLETSELEFEPGASDGLLHPGVSAHICRRGRQVGRIGKLHPRHSRRLELPEHTYVAEVELEAIISESQPLPGSSGGSGDTPTLERDLTVDVPLDGSVTHAEICRKCREVTEAPWELVDRFLAQDMQALTYRFRFQGQERTLTSDEVQATVERVKSHLRSQLPQLSFRDLS